MFSCPWNTSYRLGYHHSFSQEPTYFFTFYSEFGERALEPWLEAGFLAGALLFSVVSNSLLMVGLLRARQKTVSNIFLLSLATGDYLFALGTPAVLSARFHPDWSLGDAVCRLLPYSQLVCGFTVLWSLTLLSMERYRCLSLEPRLQLSRSAAMLVVLGLWLVALLLFSPVLLWFHLEEELGVCTIMFPRAPPLKVSLIFTVLVTILSSILPMAILVFNYQRIFIKMVQSRERWSTPTSLTSSLTRQEQQRLDKHIRVMRASLLNVAVVLLMWLPITVVLCLIYIDGDRPVEDTGFFLRSHHFLAALALALLNTAVNPILSGALKLSCCPTGSQGTPSLSRLLRLGSSIN